MLPLLSTSGTLRIIGSIQEISRITKQMEMDKEIAEDARTRRQNIKNTNISNYRIEWVPSTCEPNNIT